MTFLQSFSTNEKKDVSSEIKRLNSGKAIHDTDISVKILKENVDFRSIFAYYLIKQFIHLNFDLL